MTVHGSSQRSRCLHEYDLRWPDAINIRLTINDLVAIACLERLRPDARGAGRLGRETLDYDEFQTKGAGLCRNIKAIALALLL